MTSDKKNCWEPKASLWVIERQACSDRLFRGSAVYEGVSNYRRLNVSSAPIRRRISLVRPPLRPPSYRSTRQKPAQALREPRLGATAGPRLPGPPIGRVGNVTMITAPFLAACTCNGYLIPCEP